jgi:predicted AAA+ superfamily ATPase
MIPRPGWLERLHEAWTRRSIVWLSGVRRVGKTTLARDIEGARYLNCDLPSASEQVADPERFLGSLRDQVLILDEVHQLPDPTRILKIAADEFPGLKVLATGSSTLAATSKFRDGLTGRKVAVHLVPVLFEELPAFGADPDHRLLAGGLPENLLADERNEEAYGEWLDSFFARDVQELFRVGKRSGFLRLTEALFRQSGGLAEVTSLAKLSGLSRPTVMAYLEALEITHAIHVLRPWHGGARRELVRQPKIYGFDTGFVTWSRGFRDLRPEDRGLLFEHLVLDSLLTVPEPRIHFWRDKQRREIDFVLPRGRGACDTVECKWNPAAFDPRTLSIFRTAYPEGRNYVVTPRPGPAVHRRLAGLDVTFLDPVGLREVCRRR